MKHVPEWRLAVIAFLLSLAAAGDLIRGDEPAEVPPDVAHYLKSTEEEAMIPLASDTQNTSLVYGTFGPSTRVGDIGVLDKLKVLQIIDERSMRAAVWWTCPAKFKVRGPAGKEFNQLHQFNEDNVLISGYSTKGMVDDASYTTDAVFKIVGTETYDTAIGGTKTVFKLEPLDIRPYADIFAAAAKTRTMRIAEQAEATQQAKIDAERQSREDVAMSRRQDLIERLTRTWTDSTGRFQTKARLVAILPGPVAQLEKDDGSRVELKLFKLNAADRAWILEVGKSLLEEFSRLDKQATSP